LIQEKTKNFTFHINEDDAEKRLDNLLVHILPGLSRSYIQKLIENNTVCVNGIPVNKNYRVRPNDKIEISDIDACMPPEDLIPLNKSLKIVYEDPYFIAVSKEPGISVHPAAGNSTNTLANAIVFYFKNHKVAFDKSIRPGIVHRLDKDTSGLIIIAKEPSAQYKLSDLFKQRKIEKCYAALVTGNFYEKTGLIDLPVGRSRIDRKRMSVSIDDGREAVTEFKIVECFDRCTLVDVFPKTGRTHQIRVHFSYINHPVVGDTLYGTRESNAIAKKIGLDRQFLHAKILSFVHPITGEKIELFDELSPDLEKSLGFLRTNKI
jgi:23S rRNA pseudouridine1911/1915/1917 synthase